MVLDGQGLSGIILGLNLETVLVFECKLCRVWLFGGNHMIGSIGKVRMIAALNIGHSQILWF